MTLILIALFICIVVARYSVITGLIFLAIFLTTKVFYLMLGSVSLILLCIWFVINHYKYKACP